MKTWVKLYTEIKRDADMGTLTWAQRGIWSYLLVLAGEIDDRDEAGAETGILDTPERVAWHLRLTTEELADALDAFKALGMVDETDGVLFLPNYAKRQGRAPSDRNAAVTERVKRHRAERADSVKRACNEDVTSAKRGVTSSDSDSDSDTDTEKKEGGAVAPPPAPPKPSKPRDERLEHVAIQAIRSVTGRYPPKGAFDRVIREVGAKPDLKKMRDCYEVWVSRHNDPLNLDGWLFDWYFHGVREQVPRGARASPAPVETDEQREQRALAENAKAREVWASVNR